MIDQKKRIITVLAILAAALLTLAALAGCSAGKPDGTKVTEEPVPEIKVLAHWKLQNEEGCFTGSVDDTVGFRDLTGNGNDLIAKIVGNGSELDIFSWDKDVDPAKVKFASALKLNNTKALAATVDPYKSDETSYTGGYTSGKYLEKGPAGMTDEVHAHLVQTYQEITEAVGSQFPVLEG